MEQPQHETLFITLFGTLFITLFGTLSGTLTPKQDMYLTSKGTPKTAHVSNDSDPKTGHVSNDPDPQTGHVSNNSVLVRSLRSSQRDSFGALLENKSLFNVVRFFSLFFVLCPSRGL